MISEQEALFNGPPPAEPLAEPLVEEKVEEEDENLVVATRVSSRVKGFSIKQIYEEVTKNEPASVPLTHSTSQIEEGLKKQTQIKHKASATEKEKKKADSNLFGKLTEEAMNIVQSLVDVYKFSNCNRFVGDVTERTRAEFKEKVSLYLFYGIQELKLLPEKELSVPQKDLINHPADQQIQYVKNLAIETQLYMIRFHNKFYKMKIQRAYKDRANIILLNLKDEANQELRRKVLSKAMTTEALATAREIDLYTTVKRDQMLMRSRNIMAQSTLEYRRPEQEQETVLEVVKEEKQKQEVPEAKEKYLEDKLTLEVLELMNKHIDGFYSKLRNDLPDDEARLLCSHLDVTFAGFKSKG